MRLRRIEIRDFRKLRGHTVIDELATGVSVIGGDNEDGKSTVFAAIRACLFERHRVSGAIAQSFLPFGSKCRPEVTLDFELGGRGYRLHKAFCQNPEASLVDDEGHEFSGEHAEDKIFELLGVRAPKRGASQLEDQATFGMLWVEQGMTHLAPSPSGTSRDTLGRLVEDEVGDMLGGLEGSSLLRAVSDQYRELLGKTGKPRGEYKKQLAAVDKLRAKVTDAEQAFAEYEEKLAELAVVDVELSTMRQDDVVANARIALAEAKKGLSAVDKKTAAAQDTKQAHEMSIARSAEVTARAERRKQQLDALRAAHQHLETLTTRLSTERKKLGPNEKHLRAHLKQLEKLKADRDEASKLRDEAEQTLELAQAYAELDGLARKLKKADETQVELDAARKAAERESLSPEELERLETLAERAREAKLALDGAATAVAFELEDGAALTLELQDGEDGATSVTPASGESLRITQRATLHVPGVGKITIEPGASSIEERRAAHESAERELRAALDAHDIEDLESTKKRSAVLAARISKAETVIDTLLPEGRAAVEAQSAEAQARVDALSESQTVDARQLSLLMEGVGDRPSVTSAQAELNKATRAFQRVAADVDAADKGREELQQMVDDERELLLRLEGEFSAIGDKVQEINQWLEADRVEFSDDELRTRAASAAEERELAAAARSAADKALAELKPDEIRHRVETAQATFDRVTERYADLQKEFDQARAWLDGRGRGGVGEELAALRGELELAENLAARTTQEANAVALLQRTLESAAKDARESCVEPVAKRVQARLRQLFPERSIALSSDLSVLGVAANRGSIDSGSVGSGSDDADSRPPGDSAEPFDALSHGTREQIAILTRLAYAELLAEGDGEAPPLLLDDALVFSDEGRFDRMKEILREAADRIQIVVFSCRPRDWTSIAEQEIRLTDARSQNEAPSAVPERADVTTPATIRA